MVAIAKTVHWEDCSLTRGAQGQITKISAVDPMPKGSFNWVVGPFDGTPLQSGPAARPNRSQGPLSTARMSPMTDPQGPNGPPQSVGPE